MKTQDKIIDQTLELEDFLEWLQTVSGYYKKYYEMFKDNGKYLNSYLTDKLAEYECGTKILDNTLISSDNIYYDELAAALKAYLDSEVAGINKLSVICKGIVNSTKTMSGMRAAVQDIITRLNEEIDKRFEQNKEDVSIHTLYMGMYLRSNLSALNTAATKKFSDLVVMHFDFLSGAGVQKVDLLRIENALKFIVLYCDQVDDIKELFESEYGGNVKDFINNVINLFDKIYQDQVCKAKFPDFAQKNDYLLKPILENSIFHKDENIVGKSDSNVIRVSFKDITLFIKQHEFLSTFCKGETTTARQVNLYKEIINTGQKLFDVNLEKNFNENPDILYMIASAREDDYNDFIARQEKKDDPEYSKFTEFCVFIRQIYQNSGGQASETENLSLLIPTMTNDSKIEIKKLPQNTEQNAEISTNKLIPASQEIIFSFYHEDDRPIIITYSKSDWEFIELIKMDNIGVSDRNKKLSVLSYKTKAFILEYNEIASQIHIANKYKIIKSSKVDSYTTISEDNRNSEILEKKANDSFLPDLPDVDKKLAGSLNELDDHP